MSGSASVSALRASPCSSTSPDACAAGEPAPGAGGSAAPARLPSTPAAEEWQADWLRTLPELEQLIRRLPPKGEVRVMRSSQLDAAHLDEELTSMLREQFMRAFALFRPGLISRLQPELTLLLDFLVFRFSVWEGKPLPGMALMNLRFRNERAVPPLLPPPAPHQQPASLTHLAAAAAAAAAQQQPTSLMHLAAESAQQQPANEGACPVAGGHSGVEGPGLSTWQRGGYCLGAVALRYAWARLNHHAAVARWGDASSSGHGWRQRAWHLLRRAESAYRLATLLNFLIFLRSGRYRSLLERVLRARAVYRQPSAVRAISFEYLNRQLVWSELSELLLFLLPLVNGAAIKRALRAYLPRLPMLGAGAGLAAAGAAAAGAPGGSSAAAAARGGPQQPCGICSTTEILVPYAAAPCGHRFCYYCLRSQCLADPQYTCPFCLARVDAMQRVLA